MLVKIAAAVGTTVSALVGEADADVPHGARGGSAFANLGLRGAGPLVEAFGAIPDPMARAAILSAVKVLARARG